MSYTKNKSYNHYYTINKSFNLNIPLLNKELVIHNFIFVVMI